MFSRYLNQSFASEFANEYLASGRVPAGADQTHPGTLPPLGADLDDSDFDFGGGAQAYEYLPTANHAAPDHEGPHHEVTDGDASFVFYDLDIPAHQVIPVVPAPQVAAANGPDGRPDDMPDPEPDPEPDPAPVVDQDPDPAPDPIEPDPEPEGPTNPGRGPDVVPGTPQDTPQSEAPGDDPVIAGRPPGSVPDIPPDTGPATSYTSGGPASTSYNVTIEFEGTWTAELQDAFTEAADYLSTLILADLPDAIVDGVAIDDISITATLEGIDGVGGVLGSAGPRDIRDDGTFLPSTGAMTFDSADAANQDALGNWDSIVLHEMLHALGFGTLWNLMGLTSGSVAGGDIRFIGQNAIDVYQAEFPGIAGSDAGSASGVPVETEGGPGTAGGHWDELLFDEEIMTGFIDAGAFVSEMTIASLEDMGYDTAFDNPYSATDLSAPLPADPLLDLLA